MKTIMLKAFSLVKKTAFMLLVLSITYVSATANTTDSTRVDDENASVLCLKMEEGQVYFNIKYENADGGRFDILVNDINGDNLYRSTFSGKNFNRVFRAPVENGKLVIIIRDTNGSHKFELTTESKMVQEILVKRM
ncbi:hypothetical protein A4H97_22190 [Niastella yeongjuensis]|uniref:GOLD domain-containing protein n=1 Tax=Niastella yeongjuensis TaxID=354355 RepID=A0A1V9F8I4_9BACT|nr:hypothetical protein [Niastella yeongjuensis]OQP54674.1 hypothetical protein A4H97_22190 [Niastella yeongjuensis]SEO03370.1 hypothetical protein SAMN05660816_01954 [Niastella yeongjuensis]